MVPRLGPRGFAILGLVLVVGVGGVVGIQMRLAPMLRARRDATMRYIPEPDVLRLTSFGYQSVSADLLWIRAIQNLAADFEDRDEKYEWIESLFEGITELDPRFQSAYRLGATWLTLIKRDGAAGIRLLEKGIRENPDSWALPHDLGMIYYVDRKDRSAALEAMKAAVEKPDCPHKVRQFVAFLMVEKDEAWGAIAMWLRYCEQNQSDIVRDVAWENICKIQRQMLREGVAAHHEETGSYPESLQDLLASGRVPLREGFDLLDGISYDAQTGEVDSPKLDQIRERKNRVIIETAIKVYRERTGASPREIDDLLEVLFKIPRHPDHDLGRRYALDPETLEIEVKTVPVEAAD